MNTLAAVQGNTVVHRITLRDASGAVYTGYTGSEALSVPVWTGADAAPVAGVATAAWATASQGTVDVTISGTATAALEPATYRLKLLVAGADAYEGMLEIGWSPGSATAPSVIYCTYRDLKALVPTIEKLRSKLEDQAGYLDQRVAATDWFQDLIHRHYRGSCGISGDYAFLPWLGGYGPFGPQVFRPGTKSAIVQGWLDAGRLDVTSQVKRACAAYAVAEVCRQAAVIDPKGGWALLVGRFAGMAEDMACSITCEIDANGDGTNDTWVRLGVHDTLEG